VAALAAIQLEGAILDGKYRVGRPLGKGGMGAVYLATHLGTTRTIAIKVIVPELAQRDEFILRFQREAEAAGRLRHPNVVNVTDFGLTTLSGTSLAYLVMEYLDGQSLGEHQAASGRPQIDLVLDIVDQVALALDAAHQAGIVHRDLKPDNIWLESNRRGGYNVKVLDFGIAKLSDPLGSQVSATSASVAGQAQGSTTSSTPALDPENTETLAIAPTRAVSGTLQTIAGSVLGTPAYMSPEQCLGEAVDFRADIYSLAIITYELVAGIRPFHADTVAELLTMQVEKLPPPPSVNNAAIPKQVAAAVLHGLEKDPARRPPTAGTFAALLRAGAQGEYDVLRKSKDVFHSHPTYFFPVFLLCFVPLLLPLMGAMTYATRVAYRAKIAPDAVLIVALYFIYLLLLLFCFQCVKAASALLLREAIAGGGFRPAIGRTLGRIVRGLPQILRTQLVSAMDLRPASFRDNLLWPVVWGMEDLSGRAAIERSRELCAMLPAISLNFVPRQYSPGLVALLLLPSVFSVIGPGALPEMVRQTLSGGFFGGFALVYPAMSIIFYSQYANAFVFLYWLLDRCRGGSTPTLPTSRLGKERKRSSTVRPVNVAWWVIPAIVAGVLLFGTLRTPRSALLSALDEGRGAAILKAIDSGANIETKDPVGMTPLLVAARSGELPAVQALLDRGANVNARNSHEATPLILATSNNHANVVPLLLARGAAIDAKNRDGRTALCIAALHGYVDLVGILMAHGANPGIADVYRKTPLDYAREDGSAEIITRLATR
jgi:serine/threonine protein kinase